jgi:Ca2+/Na+ antiporter
MMKEFTATMDKTVKKSTLFSLLMFVLIFIYFLYISMQSGNYLATILFLILAFLSYLLPLLFRPQKYIITDNELEIKRTVGSVKIRLEDIKKVERIDETALRGIKRVFGSGGIFGYFGIFKNKELGTMRLYTTRKDERVYILTSEGKNIIISPDNSEEFVQALKTLTEKNKIGQ